MPIAIAPVDGQRRPVGVEFVDQGRQQGPVLGVDRADAAEQLVVPRDLQQPLARHILAAGDVFQKRHDVVRPFRPAEGEQQAERRREDSDWSAFHTIGKRRVRAKGYVSFTTGASCCKTSSISKNSRFWEVESAGHKIGRETL